MSQHLHEFNLSDERLLYPVPMTERIRVLEKQIIFQFPDAVFSVQGSDERLGAILHELLEKGYVTGAMQAQMVDRSTSDDS